MYLVAFKFLGCGSFTNALLWDESLPYFFLLYQLVMFKFLGNRTFTNTVLCDFSAHNCLSIVFSYRRTFSWAFDFSHILLPCGRFLGYSFQFTWKKRVKIEYYKEITISRNFMYNVIGIGPSKRSKIFTIWLWALTYSALFKCLGCGSFRYIFTVWWFSDDFFYCIN